MKIFERNFLLFQYSKSSKRSFNNKYANDGVSQRVQLLSIPSTTKVFKKQRREDITLRTAPHKYTF